MGFDLRISHTALATENQSACVAQTGPCERPSLQGRPAHDFVADLAWEHGPLRLRYGVDAVSGIRISRDLDTTVPTRVLHSTGARLMIPGARGLSLSLDVRNLLDLRAAEYQGIAIAGVPQTYPGPIGDLYDYPLPGRRVLLSARWVLDH